MAKKLGRPAHVPTDQIRARIKIMTVAGMRAADIAKVLEISHKTFWRYYKKEFQTAAKDANAQVVAHLFQMTKKFPAAAIFWCKTRLHWRESDELDQQDRPINITINGLDVPARNSGNS